MNDARKNSWIREKTTELLRSPVMNLLELQCRSSEDGRPHKFYTLHSSAWANVIPVTEDGKIVMVRQFRIGIDQHTLEIPGGVVDPADASIEAGALREMTEETGYAPLPGATCVPLGWMHPNPAILDNRCHTFITGPVRRQQEQHLDSGEMIEVVEVALEDIPRRILEGEITHALMLNAFFFLLLRTPGGSAALVERLRDFTTR